MNRLAAMAEPRPDDELVRDAQRGDRFAFGELVTRHQHRIFSICRRWLGDAALAEEVAQDAFLSAWRALPGFRAEARFDTWLRRIAVNKCRNRKVYGRRRAEDRHDSLTPREDVVGPQLVHPGPGADAPLHAHQATDLIEQGLAALHEDQRAIIVLRDLEDLDYDEIATLLDVPRGTVKSRLHRARAALASALAHRIGPEDVL